MWRSDKWRKTFFAYVNKYCPGGVADFLVALDEYEKNDAATTEDAYAITEYFGALLKNGMTNKETVNGIMTVLNNASSQRMRVVKAPKGVFNALNMPELCEKLFKQFNQYQEQ
jgi:hypothetical protein